MIAKSKLFGIALALAASITAAQWLTGTEPAVAAPTKDASRWDDAFAPTSADIPAAPTVKAGKSDRLSQAGEPAGCGRNAWPYILFECLVSIDGSAPRRASRTVRLDDPGLGVTVVARSNPAAGPSLIAAR